MSRRGMNRGTAPGNRFGSALDAIRDKELNVFHATIEPQFTMDDVVNWLFPEDTIRKLKDAYPLAAARYHSNCVLTSLPLPSGDKVALSLDLDSIRMQCPKLVPGKPLDGASPLLAFFQSVCDVNKQFNKVRKVIEWFDEHSVTIGAAVYYWPTILSLLPPTHLVHEASGERYREVSGIAEIVPLLRETAGIVAGASLCPATPNSGKHSLTITCLGASQQQFQVL
jgi:hypothetical protein